MQTANKLAPGKLFIVVVVNFVFVFVDIAVVVIDILVIFFSWDKWGSCW